ncbi:MAG: hypothetical protein ACXAC6_04000 [Candidatus Hodarchaeales archaeon]
MGSLSIAWKDITRKKQRSILYVFTLSLVNATGVSLYIISSALKSQIVQASGKFNGIILQVMIDYMNFLILFSFLTSIVVASVLVSLLTVARMKDLAIFQSIGGTYKQIQRIPIAEIFIITSIACFLGIIEGIIGGYFLLLSLSLNHMVINIFSFGFFILQFILISVIGTYLVSGFFVNYLLRRKFNEIMNSQYEIISGTTKTAWGFSTKKRTGFKFGHLFQQRSPMISRIMILGILILTLISSFGILGGSIIQETTDSYIKRGYGAERNTTTIAVTPTQDCTNFLRSQYDANNELSFDIPMNFTKKFFSPEFFSQIPQGVKYESRLLSIATIHLIVNRGDVNKTNINVGNNTFQTYLWGVDSTFENVLNYYSAGKGNLFPLNDDLFLGDSYQPEIREKHSSKLFPKTINSEPIDLQRFNIVKMLIDPFAHGFCTYININSLTSLTNSLNNSMRNVIFFSNPNQDIYNFLKTFNLDYFSLQLYSRIYLDFSQNFWSISNTVLIPVFVSIGLSLVAFSNLYAIMIKKDLYIMRVLGGRQRILKRILLWINLLISIQGVIPGILLGFSLAISVLIPEPILPTISSWILLFISFLSIIIIIERYLTRFTHRVM